MWSEEIDKRIREGSENPTHAYDERAWDKMESLLDKHLPQKKKRRGLILLLSFILVAGIPTFYILQQATAKNHFASRKDSTVAPISPTRAPAAGGITPTAPERTSRSTIAAIPQQESLRTIIPQASNPSTTDKIDKRKVNSSSGSPSAAPWMTSTDRPSSRQDKAMKKQDARTPNMTNTDTAFVAALSQRIGPGSAKSPEPPTPAGQKNIAVAAPDSQHTEMAVENIKKQKVSPATRGNKLSLNFSAGPDISGIGMEYTGRLKLQAGLGLSYALSKRLTVRTGFFVSRKIYSADSSEYHPPHNFWNYYPNLEKVDANCLVYEIPVSIVYNISTGKKGDWFVSTGISSYLMKKEDYGFSYKDNWGATQYHHLAFNNENRHLFSVLNISTGYQHRFTDRLSLMIEPYAKIPLSGVGFGKVKLNSGGVLFTLGLKPFLKKN